MEKQNEGSIAIEDSLLESEEYGGGAFYRKCAWVVGKTGVLWRNRGSFARNALIGTILAVALAFWISNRYEADLTLMPPNSSSLSMVSMLMGNATDASGGGAGAGGAASAAGAVGDLLGLKDAGQLYVHAAIGQTVTDRIIRRFNLMQVYHCRYIEDCRKKLAHKVDVEEDKKAATIEISVTDKDPKRATDIANAYYEELNRLLLEVNSTSARQEREVTGARVEEARKELEEASRLLADFASKNTTLEPDDQGKAAVEISAAIEGELIAAQSDLKSMEQLYTGNNERIYSARARVAELQKQLEKANSAGVRGVSKEGDMPSVRQLPILAVHYLDLYRAERVREYVFRVLVQEYELARIREKFQVDTVSILDPAVVPTKPSWPGFPTRIVLFVFLALLLSSGATLLGDWWEKANPQNHWKVLLAPMVQSIEKLLPRRLRSTPSAWADPLFTIEPQQESAKRK